jgi:hypothetical protein
MKTNNKIIAVKSIKFVIIELIGLIISMAITILFINVYINNIEPPILLLAIFSGIITLWIFYLIFNTLLKPKIVIDEENFGINIYFLFNKKVYLKYKDIIYVTSIKCRGRGMKYRFGELYIHTRKCMYKVKVIKDVKKVEEYLNSKINFKAKKGKSRWIG